MQNTTKARATGARTSKSVTDPAASGAASTSTFFTHWRGRTALTIPPARLLGGLVTVAGSSLISLQTSARPAVPPPQIRRRAPIQQVHPSGNARPAPDVRATSGAQLPPLRVARSAGRGVPPPLWWTSHARTGS